MATATVTVAIHDLNNLGCGVGRLPAHADGSADASSAGLVVFVKGAVTGDVVRAQIIKSTPSYAVGRLLEVITPSPMRTTEDFCTAPEACGGCVYRHLRYEDELLSKQNRVKNAFRQAGLSDVTVRPVLSTGVTKGYRNKGMYPVRPGKRGMEAGFFAAKSHKLIPCTDCSLQPERFGELVRAVCTLCDRYGVTAYDEASGQGILRHIYLRAAADGSILLTLIINADRLPKAAAEGLVHELVGRFPDLVGILLNINRKDTNVVLGDTFRTLWGQDYLEDVLCGKRLRLSAGSFYQVNHDAAERLYRTAADMANLRGDEHLLDLYCGAGSIGLSMADRVADITGIEIIPAAVDCARQNAALNGLGTDRARFFCGDASDAHRLLDAADEGGTYDIVVIDPPRKGTTPALISEIAARGIERVVYISCDPETLGRDCAIFASHGYTVGDVQPVDLFPRTGHVECVVLLSREKVKTMDDGTMLCDMHIHSNCSDGSFPPEELINEAKKEGIKAIALCDHNTVSGLTRFVNASKNSGVIAVPGVEVTSAYNGKEVHVLGLFLKESQYPKIAEYLEQINVRKIENNQMLAKRLNEGGFAINYEAVLNIAGDAIPNRVHFAKALLEKGYISSVSEAFETVLAENGVFYKPAEKLDALEVVRFLRSVGAVPVLAHPFLNFSLEELKVFLPKAKKCGLVGMETVYPLFSKEEAALAKSLAKEYGLIPSGGSDFHGTNKPDIKMGRGKDNITVPYQFYENLKKSI